MWLNRVAQFVENEVKAKYSLKSNTRLLVGIEPAKIHDDRHNHFSTELDANFLLSRRMSNDKTHTHTHT